MSDFKIALICPVGGQADNFYNYGLSFGLAKNAVEVFYCTSNSTEKIDHQNVHTLFFFSDIWKQKTKIRKMKKYLAGINKTLKFSKKNGIKVLHFMVFNIDWMLYVTIAISKILGFKVVTTIHDVKSFAGQRMPTLFEKKLLRKIDEAIVHNVYSMQELQKLFKSDHYHAIAHGNYIDFIKKVDDQPKHHCLQLLFFGQIKKVKGLDILLNALGVLKEKGLNLKLIIAGRVWKDDFGNYEQIIEKYNLGGMVEKHLEFIPNDKMWDYFNNANLVILPYREIYQSGVLLMALSFGRAVLTSDIPAFSNAITDKKNGFLFKDDDPESLANRIEYIYNNKHLLNEVEDEGYKYVKTENDWADSAMKIKNIYKSLLQS